MWSIIMCGSIWWYEGCLLFSIKMICVSQLFFLVLWKWSSRYYGRDKGRSSKCTNLGDDVQLLPIVNFFLIKPLIEFLYFLTIMRLWFENLSRLFYTWQWLDNLLLSRKCLLGTYHTRVRLRLSLWQRPLIATRGFKLIKYLWIDRNAVVITHLRYNLN